MRIETKLNNSQDIIISITLSHDKKVQQLNKKYLNRNLTTDVLSFNIDEKVDGKQYYLGDVIVNIDQAKRQSAENDNSLEQEISELVQHGVLHLLGVHHPHDDDESIHDIKIKK